MISQRATARPADGPTAVQTLTGPSIRQFRATRAERHVSRFWRLEFDNQGAESARATYQAEKRTIFVNLDHPQIAAALQGRSPEDAVFKRLAYEVAFSEYAVALAQELDNHGEYADVSDPIVDIRETLNRVALAAASLYS